MVRLVEASSHPDMRWLERVLNDKGNLNRNIKVEQIRELGEFMSMTAALSPWRVAVIDTVDELESSGANALLKMLEEPPANTLFFLVSHAPGDRKSTRLNSSHPSISYAVFCLKKKNRE